MRLYRDWTHLLTISLDHQPTTAPEHKATATAVTTTLLPLLVRLLADTNDETSSSVIPFANAVLSAYKKDKKRALGDGSSAMTPERSAFLAELLKVTVQKMEYKEDADWSMSIEGEEDEEMLQFIEMRRVHFVKYCLMSHKVLTYLDFRIYVRLEMQLLGLI